MSDTVEILKVRLIFSLLTWNSEKEVFPKMFVAETGSVLTKPVASFQSPRLHYPALLLFSPRPYDKVLTKVSCHIDMPPIKPLVLFFILFLLLQEPWKPNAEDGSTVR